MIKRYGRYEILYKLGQGAMAEVYLARDPVLSRFVAVKVLHADVASQPNVWQRFFNEARIVALVRNPHVVEVFDFGQEGKELYLVMEFVDGQSLQSLLNQVSLSVPTTTGSFPPVSAAMGSLNQQSPRFEPMNPYLAAALVCQAAEGLSMAAQHGIVHRDVKPENLMINRQGYLKISDFGIAHMQDASLTNTGTVLGSPLFMSPEQSRGIKPITSQADMFSLGGVLYTCLTGHTPFRAKSVNDLFHMISYEAHAPLGLERPGLNPALATLVDTLLRKNPNQRGGGPVWLHKQLRAFLALAGYYDPIALIREYMQQLAARGVQTTWGFEPSETGLVTTQKSSMAATEKATMASNRRKPLASAFLPFLMVIISLLTVAGLWSAFIPGLKSDEHTAGPAKSLTHKASEIGIPVPGENSLPEKINPGESGPDSFPSQIEPRAEPVPTSNPQPFAEAPLKDSLASLTLLSSPPFAEIFLDGKFIGITPAKVGSLSVGLHRIVMKSKHMPSLDTTLFLDPGPQAVKFRLDDEPGPQFAGQPSDDTK